MKKLLATLLLSPLAITACGGNSSDNTIKIYTNRKEANVQWILDEYKKANPSAPAMELVVGSETDLMSKFILESNNNVRTADVLLMQDALIMEKNSNLFADVNKETLQLVGEDSKDPEGKWIGVSARARVIAYNEAKVKETNLELYNKLSNNRATIEDIFSQGANSMIRDAQNIYLRNEIAGHYAKAKASNEDEAFKHSFETFYKTVKDGQGFSTAGDRGVLDAVKDSSNGVHYGLVNSYYYYGAPACTETVTDKCGYIDDENIKVSYVDSENKGTFTDLSTFGISNKSNHKEEIGKLLNYFLDESVQEKIPTRDGSGEFPTLTSITKTPEYMPAYNSFKKLNTTVGFGEIVKVRDEAFSWLDSLVS